jgi:acetolactate synthase-1/2/3 large subunit
LRVVRGEIESKAGLMRTRSTEAIEGAREPRRAESEPQLVAPTLADQLVLGLAAADVVAYFGVPGGAIEPLFNALARHGDRGRVRLIPMRSESGAGFAADGYFRQSGKMAVCTATTGPGVSNLVTPVMSAHADRVPLLVLTPQVSLAKQGRGALQDSSGDGYDTALILRECTRYSTVVTHAAQLGHKLERALEAAWRSPRGPVHVSVPQDVLGGTALAGFEAAALRGPISPRAVDAAAVSSLCAEIVAARAPVFYVGDDAGADAPLLFDAARALGAAVVSSPAGKRWIGHRARVYRGAVGFSGDPAARDVLAAATLVVAFGATFDELSSNAWSIFPKAPIYAVDRHSEHAHRVRARVVIASIEDVLAGLRSALPVLSSPGEAVDPSSRRAEEAGPVHPIALMHWLGRELPDDVVVHLDAGNAFSWSTRYLRRAAPDTYRVAMGLSAMGWAVSSVIGAAVASGRRTVCVTGDGAMLMSALELTVAVEQRLPITYVILNDEGLGMVRHGQRMAGAASIAHSITPVRFDRLAEACGAPGARIETAAELRRVPRAWLEDDRMGPCVLDVCIDREAVPPMVDRVLGLAGRTND